MSQSMQKSTSQSVQASFQVSVETYGVFRATLQEVFFRNILSPVLHILQYFQDSVLLQ